MPLPATDDPAWQKLARSTGASSREEILADIGLGKRLAAVVARRFAPEHQLVATTAAAVDELTSARSAPILIQGNEGQAVQLAPCGPARRSHHRRHAHGPRPGRAHGRLPGGHAPAPARTGTLDQCGLGHAHGQAPRHPPGHRHTQRAWRAGRLAAEVTAADANIVHVTMHDDAVATVSLHLTIQVDSRKHLAQVIRAIRHVPQVQKIVRVRVTTPKRCALPLRGMSTDRRSRIRDIPIWAPVLVAVCFLLPTDSCSCPACSPAVQAGWSRGAVPGLYGRVASVAVPGLAAVEPYAFDALADLYRVFEGGAVQDAVRVEQDQIGVAAGFYAAAVLQAIVARPGRSSCGWPVPASSGRTRAPSLPGCAGRCPTGADAGADRTAGRRSRTGSAGSGRCVPRRPGPSRNRSRRPASIFQQASSRPSVAINS